VKPDVNEPQTLILDGSRNDPAPEFFWGIFVDIFGMPAPAVLPDKVSEPAGFNQTEQPRGRA